MWFTGLSDQLLQAQAIRTSPIYYPDPHKLLHCTQFDYSLNYRDEIANIGESFFFFSNLIHILTVLNIENWKQHHPIFLSLLLFPPFTFSL